MNRNEGCLESINGQLTNVVQVLRPSSRYTKVYNKWTSEQTTPCESLRVPGREGEKSILIPLPKISIPARLGLHFGASSGQPRAISLSISTATVLHNRWPCCASQYLPDFWQGRISSFVAAFDAITANFESRIPS